MALKVLILGASYGSLLGTKLLMAGHDVTLVCRRATAELINMRGTEVRLALKGETARRRVRSADLPGRLDAEEPETVDLCGLRPRRAGDARAAVSAPHGANPSECDRGARVPCLSLMNMPPLSYLKRIAGIDAVAAEAAYSDARVWDRFDPQLVTLCSPDPQAARLADEPANVLAVNLAYQLQGGDPSRPRNMTSCCARSSVTSTLSRSTARTCR